MMNPVEIDGEMVIYKLTSKDMETFDGCQWRLGGSKETDGGGELCTRGWLHFYHHPLLAVYLNPIHARFDLSTARMFRGVGRGMWSDDSRLKGGCTHMTLVEEVAIPVVSDDQRVRFAISCAMETRVSENFRQWADGWISGADRSWKMAERALQETYRRRYNHGAGTKDRSDDHQSATFAARIAIIISDYVLLSEGYK